MDREVVPVVAWARRRLQAVVAGAGVVVLLLLGGIGYAVYATFLAEQGSGAQRARAELEAAAQAPPGQVRRDLLAAAAMLAVDPGDALGGPAASSPAPTILIPAAGGTGPVGVASGFPQTPAGAVGQLAAIQVAVLQQMSIAHATATYQGWALPGGVGPQAWSMTRNVAAFLGTQHTAQAKAVTTTVTARPVAAQIKGSDGPDWTLACTLLVVTARDLTQEQIAYGSCERMQWVAQGTGGRWMIAPGAGPAAAPSTWPGTDLAARAGWQAWIGPDGGSS